MVPKFQFIFLFVALSIGDVQCDEWSRQKRSDDHPALETMVSGLSQQLTQMSAQLTELQNQHNQLTARLESSQKKVAFTARNGADPFNVGARSTLHYNIADLNLGGGFNTVTGVFTCPASGLYVFFVNCMATPSDDQDVSIVAKGGSIGNCYSSSSPSTEQGATAATTHLLAGQQVFVQLNRDSARDVRGSVFNTFSGFLVKSDD